MSDILQWTPSHGRANAGRPARTYVQQLCADTGCSLVDLPEAMDDRDNRRGSGISMLMARHDDDDDDIPLKNDHVLHPVHVKRFGVYIYIYIYIYKQGSLSFQTFFVWVLLLIIQSWNSSPLRSNLLQLQCTCCTVPTTSGRPHWSNLEWSCQWPSSQPLSSPQLSHNDSLWA